MSIRSVEPSSVRSFGSEWAAILGCMALNRLPYGVSETFAEAPVDWLWTEPSFVRNFGSLTVREP